LKPICLITGATDGVGKATALALARKGFHVVLAGRYEAKARAVRAEIEAVSGQRDVDVVIGDVIGDLAPLAQVRQLSKVFKERYPKLGVLINNAGVMLPERRVTEDGFEAAYQINYLSAYFLTRLLLDHLRRSDQGRIINLSSRVYTLGKFDPANLQCERRYSAIGAYASAKLFMLLFSMELAKRSRRTPITASAVHPGVVRSQMLATAQGFFKLLALIATPFALSPEKGLAPQCIWPPRRRWPPRLGAISSTASLRRCALLSTAMRCVNTSGD
jgi:retinol dehydrogenase 12